MLNFVHAEWTIDEMQECEHFKTLDEDCEDVGSAEVLVKEHFNNNKMPPGMYILTNCNGEEICRWYSHGGKFERARWKYHR